MRIIGLTGGIACGKSNISRVLSGLQARIVDGDVLSRELTAPGGAALPALHDRFGDPVFHDNGALNRKALASLIFSDDAARAALDSIMQPLLLLRIHEEIAAARRDGVAICVLDMPLLYEKGLEALCDCVWCSWLPQGTQLQRLMARDGLNAEQALQRIASQMPTDEKAARADVVIDTSGTFEETEALIINLYAQETGSAPR